MKTKTPFLWMSYGCAGLIAIGLAMIAGLGYLASQNTRLMADPVKTHREALTLLGAETIPPDYAAEVAMSIPFFTDLVVLQGEKSQFVFLARLQGEADLSAAFTDEASFDSEMGRAGLRLKRRQTALAHEVLQAEAAEIRYSLYDGRLEFDVTRSSIFDFDFGELVAGEGDINYQLGAVVLIRCPLQSPPILGFWAGPHAATTENADPPETEAATAAFRELISRFGFCDA